MDNNFDALFQEMGLKYGVDPALLKAQAGIESGLNPNATGPQTPYGQAQGIAQIIPATAQSLGVNPNDPRQAIEGQARLMAENYKRYGTIPGALAAYHGGTDQGNWGPKTQQYVQKVSSAYQKTQPMPDLDELEKAYTAGDETPAQGAPPIELTPEQLEAAYTQDAPQADIPHITIAPRKQEKTPDTKSLSSMALDALMNPTGVEPQDIHPLGVGALAGLTDIPISANKLVHSVYDFDNSLPAINSRIADRNTAIAQATADNPLMGGIGRAGGQLLGMAPVADAVVPAQALQSLKAAYPALAPYVDFASGSLSQGNKLAQYGSKALGGAGAGAGVTALTSAASNAPVQDQLKSNMKFGAAMGAGVPAAFDAMQAVGQSAGNATKRMFSPGSAAADRAHDVIENFAGSPMANINAQEIVPGSTPTLAEAANDPNLAVLQRTLQKDNPAAFDKLEQNNNAARLSHIEGVSGTPQDIEAAEAAREATRDADVQNLWKPGATADTQSVIDKIDSILSGPGGKRPAVQSSLQNVKDMLAAGDKGNLITDPETLYQSARKGIGDMLDAKNLANPSGRQASRELMQVQDQLDATIDKAAPGFKDYMQNYANSSHDIDAMRFMQGLNLKDAKGNVTLAKVQNALSNIQKLQSAPGINSAKHLTDDHVQALMDVRDDLLRRERVAQASMPRNSATMQNIVAEANKNALMPGANMLSGKIDPEVAGATAGTLIGHAMGSPLLGGFAGDVLGRTGAKMSAAQLARVTNELERMMLDPQSYVPRFRQQPAVMNSIIPESLLLRNSLGNNLLAAPPAQ